MRVFWAICLGALIVGCGGGGDDDPKPPEAANLVFPEQNSECTTGVDVTESTSEVTFRWQAADNADSYELRVTHLITNVTQTATSTGTSAALTIAKGAPFSWMVISRNADAQSVSSATWQFYNAGSETSYAPFPATILAPPSGITVVRDRDGEVLLDWSGADVDNDLSGYDIYHGTTNPPTEIESSTNAGVTSLKVAVESGTYYWKVVSKDMQGNTSDSGVYSYRVF